MKFESYFHIHVKKNPQRYSWFKNVDTLNYNPHQSIKDATLDIFNIENSSDKILMYTKSMKVIFLNEGGMLIVHQQPINVTLSTYRRLHRFTLNQFWYILLHVYAASNFNKELKLGKLYKSIWLGKDMVKIK